MDFFALGRVVLLYSIFYLGYCIPNALLERIRKNCYLKVAMIIFAIVSLGIGTIFLLKGIVDVTWATHDY